MVLMKTKLKKLLKRLFNATVHVASGLLPVNGENGYIATILILKELKPKMLEDGTADYHDLGLVINVKRENCWLRLFHLLKAFR